MTRCDETASSKKMLLTFCWSLDPIILLCRLSVTHILSVVGSLVNILLKEVLSSLLPVGTVQYVRYQLTENSITNLLLEIDVISWIIKFCFKNTMSLTSCIDCVRCNETDIDFTIYNETHFLYQHQM